MKGDLILTEKRKGVLDRLLGFFSRGKHADEGVVGHGGGFSTDGEAGEFGFAKVIHLDDLAFGKGFEGDPRTIERANLSWCNHDGTIKRATVSRVEFLVIDTDDPGDRAVHQLPRVVRDMAQMASHIVVNGNISKERYPLPFTVCQANRQGSVA